MVVRECGICNTYSFKLADTCFTASHVDSLCKHSKCAWGKCSFLITGYRDYLYMYSIKIADWIFQVCIFANVCLLHLSISERHVEISHQPLCWPVEWMEHDWPHCFSGSPVLDINDHSCSMAPPAHCTCGFCV